LAGAIRAGPADAPLRCQLGFGMGGRGGGAARGPNQPNATQTTLPTPNQPYPTQSGAPGPPPVQPHVQHAQRLRGRAKVGHEGDADGVWVEQQLLHDKLGVGWGGFGRGCFNLIWFGLVWLGWVGLGGIGVEQQLLHHKLGGGLSVLLLLFGRAGLTGLARVRLGWLIGSLPATKRT
jgi:hypothetical protein